MDRIENMQRGCEATAQARILAGAMGLQEHELRNGVNFTEDRLIEALDRAKKRVVGTLQGLRAELGPLEDTPTSDPCPYVDIRITAHCP